MGFIASLFGGGGKSEAPPAPPPLPQPPTPDDSAQKAADLAKKKRAGLTQTVFSSPLGAAGQADVAKKSLLGT